tara:strand:- start:1940 stop:2959 length:1020 start_codon:yes stop_codon:yes gene_type:complete
MNSISKKYILISLSISIPVISAVMLYFSILYTSISCENCDFEIKKNENAFSVSKKLVEQRIINNEHIFLIGSKLLFLDKSIKPGNYSLAKIYNLKQLLELVSSSSYDYVKITIPEGWEYQAISRKLHLSNLVDSSKFNDLCKDQDLINRLSLGKIKNLEGYLFPETYFISQNQTELEIIEMMVNQFKKNINEINIDKSIKFSLHQLITLASIIQGEAMDNDEMKTISSVFYNRLNKNMNLDANATIQYIIPGKNRRLLNKDLEIKSKYNTYKNKGLPPGPINNPGLNAIIAALEPLSSDYLYFVKDPENYGKHVFNESFKGHEIARKKYLRYIRENGFK